MTKIVLPKPERFSIKMKLYNVQEEKFDTRYIINALERAARVIGVREGDRLYRIIQWIHGGGIKITPWFIMVETHTMQDDCEHEITVDLNFEVLPNDWFNANLVKELLKRAEGINMGYGKKTRYKIVSIKRFLAEA